MPLKVQRLRSPSPSSQSLPEGEQLETDPAETTPQKKKKSQQTSKSTPKPTPIKPPTPKPSTSKTPREEEEGEDEDELDAHPITGGGDAGDGELSLFSTLDEDDNTLSQILELNEQASQLLKDMVPAEGEGKENPDEELEGEDEEVRAELKLQKSFIADVENEVGISMAALNCPELPWNAFYDKKISVKPESTNENVASILLGSPTRLELAMESPRVTEKDYKLREDIASSKDVKPVTMVKPALYVCNVQGCNTTTKYLSQYRIHLTKAHNVTQSKDLPVCFYCLKGPEEGQVKRTALKACSMSHNIMKQSFDRHLQVENRYFCLVCLHDRNVYHDCKTLTNLRDHYVDKHELYKHLFYFCFVCGSEHTRDTGRQECQRKCVKEIVAGGSREFRCTNCQATFDSAQAKARHYVRSHPSKLSALYINQLYHRTPDFVDPTKQKEEETWVIAAPRLNKKTKVKTLHCPVRMGKNKKCSEVVKHNPAVEVPFKSLLGHVKTQHSAEAYLKFVEDCCDPAYKEREKLLASAREMVKLSREGNKSPQ